MGYSSGWFTILDQEKRSKEHCRRSEVILKEAGWPEGWIRAVMPHGWGRTG